MRACSPSVYDFFLDNLRDIAIASNITFNKPTTTPRWILGHLIYSFEHRKCKVRKHGTIIYRNGGDLFVSLSKALYKVRSGCNSASQAPQHTATLKSSDNTVEKINAALREQIINLIEKGQIYERPNCWINC